MVELTEREKKIVLIKFIVHGRGPYDTLPVDTRVQMLEAALKVSGIDFTNDELLDLGDAVLQVQQDVNDSLQGFLSNNKELVSRALDNMGGNGIDRLKFGKGSH